MSRVFRKTPLGIQAFRTHANVLTLAHRAILVMIDGKRSANQLRKFGRAFGDVNTILDELHHGGFIEFEPVYAEILSKVQLLRAQERETFVSDTTVGGVRKLPPAVTSSSSSFQLTQDVVVNAQPSSEGKRDLRNFATTDVPEASLTEREVSIDTTTSTRTRLSNGRDGDAINTARQYAASYVLEQIGNSGSALCIAIETATTLHRLQEIALIAEQTLGDMKGSDVASAFRDQFQAISRGQTNSG